MVIHGEQSKAKQVRRLFATLSAGVIVAAASAMLLLHFFGPNGSYLAKNVLLAPENISPLGFNERDPISGKSARFTFDLIEFSYYNTRLKKMEHIDIDMEKYVQLYKMIENEVSVPEVSEELPTVFNHSRPMRLVFKVRADENAERGNTKVFSEIDFAKDYYRISLRDMSSQKNWAYYIHPGISRKISILFDLP